MHLEPGTDGDDKVIQMEKISAYYFNSFICFKLLLHYFQLSVSIYHISICMYICVSIIYTKMFGKCIYLSAFFDICKAMCFSPTSCPINLCQLLCLLEHSSMAITSALTHVAHFANRWSQTLLLIQMSLWWKGSHCMLCLPKQALLYIQTCGVHSILHCLETRVSISYT